jgi:hypothetical protein
MLLFPATLFAADYTVTETDDEISLKLPKLEARIRKTGYVSGVAKESFLDKQTGFRDAGFGLDIVDWIMEPGSDEAYRDKLDPELIYQYNNSYHGKRPKRSIEGPQICTKAKRINAEVIEGEDFVAVKLWYQYQTAAPGKKTGSLWTQWLVFPAQARYFFSMDKIEAKNSSDAMFLRTDLPGHIRHTKGDSFSQIYLSYHGTIFSDQFLEDFPPDEKFHYLRNDEKIPERMIRAYQLRNSETGNSGPWLAGMTLDPAVVSEAWCHQRGYVCMIQEFGAKPIQAGESFQAAYLIVYFDSIEDMQTLYDRYKGTIGLEVTKDGWKLVKK